MKSIEVLFNIVDPSTKNMQHSQLLSYGCTSFEQNHEKRLNKNQSNWQIHGDDSWDDLWYIGVVFLSTRKINIPLDTAGESVRFLFLNPLPLLLGIQEIIQQSIPKMFWFLSSKCKCLHVRYYNCYWENSSAFTAISQKLSVATLGIQFLSKLVQDSQGLELGGAHEAGGTAKSTQLQMGL